MMQQSCALTIDSYTGIIRLLSCMKCVLCVCSVKGIIYSCVLEGWDRSLCLWLPFSLSLPLSPTPSPPADRTHIGLSSTIRSVPATQSHTLSYLHIHPQRINRFSIAQVWGNPSQGAQFMTGFAQNMNCELCKTCSNIKGIIGSAVIRCHNAQAWGYLEQWASKCGRVCWHCMLTECAAFLCVFFYINTGVLSWTVVFF